MKAVVLAAGEGTRLRPLTLKMPKAMIEIKGKPILEIVLEQLASTGIQETEIVVGYKKEKITNYFGKSFQGMKLNYLVQKNPKGGTGQALGLAEKAIGKENFLFMLADNLFEKKFIKKFAKTPYKNAFVGKKTKTPWLYGILKVKGKKVLDIVEKPEKGTEPTNIAATGLYKLSSKIFDYIKKTPISTRGEIELPTSIKMHMKEEPYYWIEYTGKWFDIGNIESLKKARLEF